MASIESNKLEPGMFRDAFLVFCVAEIPKEVLNRFLEQAYSQPGVQGELCVITSEDVDTVTHSSRPTIEAFQSPFLGWSIEAINDWVEENVPEKAPLSEKFYVILDEETLREAKSCLLAENVVERRRRYAEERLSPTPGYEGSEKVKSVRESFEEALQTLSALDGRSMDMVELIDG